MNNPLLLITNKHVENCGTPPSITNEDPDKYLGYFENIHGEQWIFIYDRKSKNAKLYGGDVGWDNAFEVQNGQVKGLILDEVEKMWLETCWKASNYFSES
ncbi:MAG TPA: hypothetical protein DEF42_15865 [Desulfosporosinus sp.]|nr:hypothetical protein [Desulfosporosinus sp.]